MGMGFKVGCCFFQPMHSFSIYCFSIPSTYGPVRPPTPVGSKRGDESYPSNRGGNSSSSNGGSRSNNLLYDRFPTPVGQKRLPTSGVVTSGAITEEEDEGSEDDPATGNDLLRMIEGRLRTPNMSARSSAAGGGALGLGGMAAGAGQRLQPQHAFSDPVLVRQSSLGGRSPTAFQERRRQSPGLTIDAAAAALAGSEHVRLTKRLTDAIPFAVADAAPAITCRSCF